MRIVPAFDKLEHGQPRLGLGAEAPPIQEFALQGAKKLSAMALSKQSPTEPIDGRTPASRQRLPKAMDVY